MECPYCHHVDTRVLDSRLTSTSDAIRRRRACTKCKKRFTTYERIELLPLSVVKKDGMREPFDRQKIMKGIMIACQKRPVKPDRIKQVIDEIELALRNQDRTEIESRKIGEMVIDKLKQIDEVAYVRFASVYRRFTDASQFAEEVAKLKSANNSKKSQAKTKRVITG